MQTKCLTEPVLVSDWNVASVEMINISRRGFIMFIIKTKELYIATVLPATSDSDVMFCFYKAIRDL